MAQDTKTRRTRFTFLGVPWTVDADSWKFVPPKLIIGLVAAFIAWPDAAIGIRLIMGLYYGLLLLVTLFLHIVGHILSSRWIKAPVREAHVTPILIHVLHHDTAEVSPRAHLIRALGGPLMNIALAWLSLVVWSLGGGHLLLAFANTNFAIAVLTLLPFPGVDGEVIWREIGHLRRKA
jgi:hypothetical protein